MKTLFTTFALVLLGALSLSAQQPVQDSIPQLQEWWRVDNMQYGKYGMTWLDNFYQGKGALVVWTPQGVKTWLLRFPGDTMNVFTWEKGSSNIKTADFNGDGITDYIDENSNVYEGIKNGEPPKTNAVYFGGYYPETSVDVNDDGIDDILNFPSSSLPNPPSEMKVAFGNKDLSKMTWQTIPIPHIDSNNTVVGCYTKGKDIYVVCRRYFWYYNAQKQKVIQRDGYRLVRIWWDGNAFKSEILDEFTNDVQNGSGRFWQSALLPQTLGKNYLVGAIIIKSGNLENTDVIIYDLSNDKIEKLHSNRINTIAGFGINSLKYGIDSISIPSLCIRQYNVKNEPVLHIYSGNIRNSLKEIAQFTTVQIAAVISLPDVTGDGKPDIALSNDYFPSFEKYRFSILTLNDTASSVSEDNTKDNIFSIQPLPPMPVMRSQTIQMKISIPTLGDYNLSLYDSMGKKIISKKLLFQNLGQNYINFDLFQIVIAGGKYTVELEGNGRTAHCSIIIQ